VKRRRQPAEQLFLVDEPASAKRIREGYELEEEIKRVLQQLIATKEDKQ
jgi:hypothetical protein